MNLADIIADVQREVGHKPGNRAERDNVARGVNDIYTDLLGAHPWEFIDRLFDLEWFADITGTGLSYHFKQITFASTLPEDSLLGAEISIANSAVGMDGTFDVIRWDGPGGPITTALWIDNPPVPLAVLTADPLATFTITWKRRPLPDDLETSLGLMNREEDYGAVPLVDRTAERSLMLNDDERGQAAGYVFDPPQGHDRAPRNVLSATTANVGGTLVPGTYKYLFRHRLNGRLSGRSNIAEIVVPAGTNTNIVNIIGLDDWAPLSQFFPIQRWLYREDVDTAPGVFRRVALINSTTVVTPFVDDGETPDDDLPFCDVGPYRYVRMWPRPDVDTTYELRYHPRVKRLLHDMDVPEMPVEYHQILVFGAAERITRRNNDDALSGYMKRQYEELLNRMRRRYLSQSDRRWIRHMGRDDERARHLQVVATIVP